jgi:NAD+ kinase
VRHGESEGNVALEHSRSGDHSDYTGEFLERHSSLWRLTDQGREQSIVAGHWLRDNGFAHFDCHYTSEYLRAMETAALLDLPDARWRPEVMLRERDMGKYDLASQEIRSTAFAEEELRRRRERAAASTLFWAPPGGESLAHVVHRVDSVLLFLNRRFAGRRVVLICHGEVMWAFRMRFERLSQLRYRELQARSSPRHGLPTPRRCATHPSHAVSPAAAGAQPGRQDPQRADHRLLAPHAS